VASHRPRTSYRVTFFVLCVGVASFALLQSLVNPVLPTIQAVLGTDQTTVTWVLTAYLLSASIFTPIAGRVGDKVGKERMLVVTLVALAIGSLLAAWATNIAVMILARAIQGMGGGVVPLSFGIIRDEFPRAKVAGAVGAVAALTAAGAGLGLVLAGPIVDALGYRWLFSLPMILTLAAAIATYVLVPESPERAEGPINVGAAALLSAWLVTLLLAVSQGHSWGWASPITLGLFVATAVLLPVWVCAEARSASPLIDMTMMRIPTVWTVNLVAMLFGAGLYALLGFLPRFLQTPDDVTGYGFDASVTASGLMLLPQTIAMFLAGLISGRLAGRFGSKPVLVAGAALTTISTLGLAFAHDHLWQVIIETTILGLAFGLAFAAMSNLIVEAVPQSQTGVASGMNANIRTIGGALGTAVFATVITVGAPESSVPTETGYTLGFALLAVACALTTVVAVLVPVVKAVVHVVPGPQTEAEAQMQAELQSEARLDDRALHHFSSERRVVRR
jgi:EmrB/QacA subfamily drug resistance transporter